MTKWAISLLLLLATSGAFPQQNRRDPLNDLEVDKLRDSAQEPEIRLREHCAVDSIELMGVRRER